MELEKKVHLFACFTSGERKDTGQTEGSEVKLKRAVFRLLNVTFCLVINFGFDSAEVRQTCFRVMTRVTLTYSRCWWLSYFSSVPGVCVAVVDSGETWAVLTDGLVRACYESRGLTDW